MQTKKTKETRSERQPRRRDRWAAVGPHVAWLVSAEARPQRLIGKDRIAVAIADHLEDRLLRLEA